MDKKKILIVGGAGYIGGYLTDFLNSRNLYDITVFDNLTYESHYLKKVNFIFGDVRDTKKLSKIINAYDVIVWLAAIVGDGACEVNPVLTKKINEDSVKWLVDNYKKGKIVFSSTCSVYGINNDLIDETAKTNPLSIYASTKLSAEQYIIKNYDDYLIFRLGTLFGIGDEHSRIRLDLVVNILTMKATKKEKLTVFGGEQWRPLLHVKDVSHAIHWGIQQDIKGLYNLVNKNYKISEIAESIKSIIPGIEIGYEDMKFEDLRNYRVTGKKFNSNIWKPFYNLKSGIIEIHNLIKDNRIKDPNNFIYSNSNFMREKNG